MNPYRRAVTIYRTQTSCNLSFRDYLRKIKLINFNDIDKYHMGLQYIHGEEDIPFIYIKIENNEIDLSKYNSVHHGIKTNNNSFCGDTPREIINNNLPNKYSLFYDSEIKKMVYTLYKKDIDYYGYTFEELI